MPALVVRNSDSHLLPLGSAATELPGLVGGDRLIIFLAGHGPSAKLAPVESVPYCSAFFNEGGRQSTTFLTYRGLYSSSY